MTTDTKPFPLPEEVRKAVMDGAAARKHREHTEVIERCNNVLQTVMGRGVHVTGTTFQLTGFANLQHQTDYIISYLRNKGFRAEQDKWYLRNNEQYVVRIYWGEEEIADYDYRQLPLWRKIARMFS